MSRVIVINHITLDGVMQAPGRADEDTRDGFENGGLLLGRRTYEDLLAYWNTQDSPFKDALNNAPKYVASRTLHEPLPYSNSTLVKGEALGAVAELKKEPGKDLHIMGRGKLIQSLMRR